MGPPPRHEHGTTFPHEHVITFPHEHVITSSPFVLPTGGHGPPLISEVPNYHAVAHLHLAVPPAYSSIRARQVRHRRGGLSHGDTEVHARDRRV